VKLTIEDQVFEYDNSQAAVVEMLQRIVQTMENNKLVLSHMIVDDNEVYVDFEEYLFNRLDDIKEIEVVLISAEQLLRDTLLSAEEYIERALPELEKLIDDFYEGPTEDAWYKLSQLIEGIQWLNQTAAFIQEHKNDPSSKEIVGMLDLGHELSLLEEAIEQSDMGMIGDILNYEVKSRFETMHSQVQNIIDNEVVKDDLS